MNQISANDVITAFRGHREEITARADEASSSVVQGRVAGDEWPAPLDPKAFHSSAGNFVRIVEPHTEADPAALLVQVLVGLGNAMGRSAYRIADGARHYCNLNAVLVGDTSHGRKGSAWAQVKCAIKQLDPEWLQNHVASGLSSGEGLIWAVRDPIERRDPIKEKGHFTGEY
jgi:hypothetical protein